MKTKVIINGVEAVQAAHLAALCTRLGFEPETCSDLGDDLETDALSFILIGSDQGLDEAYAQLERVNAQSQDLQTILLLPTEPVGAGDNGSDQSKNEWASVCLYGIHTDRVLCQMISSLVEIPDEATLEDILSEHDTPQDDVPAGDFFEDSDEAAIEAAADDAMEAIFDSSSPRNRPQTIHPPRKGPHRCPSMKSCSQLQTSVMLKLSMPSMR